MDTIFTDSEINSIRGRIDVNVVDIAINIARVK